MTSGMIASAAIFSFFIAPAKATIAATIVMHQVLHCALLPASREMTAWIIFKCSIAAGLSAGASGEGGLSAPGSDIIRSSPARAVRHRLRQKVDQNTIFTRE